MVKFNNKLVKKEKDLRSITHYRVMQQTHMTEEPMGTVVSPERLRLEISPEEELEIMYGSRLKGMMRSDGNKNSKKEQEKRRCGNGECRAT